MKADTVKKRYGKKLLSIAAAFILTFSNIAVPAYAARDESQSKQNEMSGSNSVYIVELMKIDRESNRPVANAVFELYRILDSGERVKIGGSYVSDPSGFISVPDIESGHYVFCEVLPPYGFEKPTELREFEFVVDGNGQPDVIFAENQRLYRDLTLTKKVVVIEGLAEEDFLAEPSIEPVAPEMPDAVPETAPPASSDIPANDGTEESADSEEIPSSESTPAAETGGAAQSAELSAEEVAPLPGQPVQESVSLQNFRSVRRGGSSAFLLGAHTEEVQTAASDASAVPAPLEATAGPGISAGAASDSGAETPAAISDSGTSTSGSESPLPGSGGSSAPDGAAQDDENSVPTDSSVLPDSTVSAAAPSSVSNSQAAPDMASSSEISDMGESQSISTVPDTSGSPSSGSTPNGAESPGSMEQPADDGDEALPAPEDTYFTFTVIIHDGYENGTVPKGYEYSIDGVKEPLNRIFSGQPTEFQLKADQTLVVHNLPVGATYEITEKRTDGYETESENSGGSITENGAQATFTNTTRKPSVDPDAGSLIITKYVNGLGADLNKKFHFTIRFTDADGKVSEDSFELGTGETKRYENLPGGTKYTITEDDYFNEGYIQSGSINFDGTIHGDVQAETTNTYIGTELLTVSGTKTWDHGENLANNYPQSVVVRLMSGDKVVAQATISAADGWQYSFTVPKYDTDGNEINYTIAEDPVPDYTGTVTGYDITNKYNGNQEPETVEIEGQKRWEHGDNPEDQWPKSIIVYLKNGTEIVQSKEVTADDNWAYSFTADKFDAFGNEIQYTVDESQIPGYTTNVAGYDITNTYAPDLPPPDETITLSGQKTWNHGNNPADKWPSSLKVYVKIGDQIVDETTITAADDWKYSFTLPKYDENGNLIRYTIDEEALAYYRKLITGTNLLNTYDPGQKPENDTVIIEGQKTWEHGDNPEGQRPGSITVYVRADGVMIRQLLVTAADGWKYSFELPRFDASGREIRYTIDEAPVANYTRETNGYDLKNTYSPPVTPPPETPDEPVGPSTPSNVPQTSDPTPLELGWALFWTGLTIASIAGAILLTRQRLGLKVSYTVLEQQVGNRTNRRTERR